MNSKILAFGMAVVSALSAVIPVFAVEQHSGDGNKVPVELTVEIPTFSVTVPTGLPVAVDAAGKVYCRTTAIIKNNTFGQVKVSNVTIEGNMPWTVADWATDMQKEKVNTTKIAMQLNNGVTDASGYQFAPENFPVIDGYSSLPLTYDAKLPAQTKVIGGDTVANVVFTVGWNTDESAPVPAPTTMLPVDKAMMATQLGSLPGTITFSKEKAPSSGTVPLNSNGSVVAKISGQDATVYSYNGGGVAAPADSSFLFMKQNSGNFYTAYKAKTLNLDGLDTSNVTNMYGMFSSSKATTLDLSSFDTSKVTDMEYMFEDSKATTLDLSGFDTSKVMNMNLMFEHSAATTITGLSSFDTSSVMNMYGMFKDSAAKSLDLSSFNTSNVTRIGSMFEGSAATTLDLSNFDTSKVTDMICMFSNSAATIIDISSFTIQPSCKVKAKWGSMFTNTTALKTLYYKDAAALAKMQEGELSLSVTTIQGPAPRA